MLNLFDLTVGLPVAGDKPRAAGDVERMISLPVDAKGNVAMKRDEMQAVTGLDKVRKTRGRPAKANEAPARPVERVQAISAPVEPPKPLPAPTDALPAILVRLARVEQVLGIVERPKRTEAHARAIVRAWEMRREMRERADLDRRALLYANGVNASLREQVDAKQAQLVAVEGARAAAVYRAECDGRRLADVEQERDEALAMATAEESRAVAVSRSLAVAGARADRLARIAVRQRSAARFGGASREMAVLQSELALSRAETRQALRKLAKLREGVGATSEAAAKLERLAA